MSLVVGGRGRDRVSAGGGLVVGAGDGFSVAGMEGGRENRCSEVLQVPLWLTSDPC